MMKSIRKRGPLTVLIVTLSALLATACTSGGASVPTAVTAPAATASASAGGSNLPSSEAQNPVVLLQTAQKAMEGVNRYAFTLQLIQELSGGAASDSRLEADNAGRVERSPLKVDQTINSESDGEKSALRAILVPDTYYVYDPELEEWGKLAKEQTADVIKTLSDYQTNPAQAMASVAGLGDALTVTQEGDQDVIRYEGNGAEAAPFLYKILEGTLDFASLDEQVKNSVQIESVKLSFTLDHAKHLPLAYHIESVMTIAYESGKPSKLKQTFAGTYSKHDATETIVVPEEAKKAPQLDQPIDDPAADEGNIGSLDDLEGLGITEQ